MELQQAKDVYNKETVIDNWLSSITNEPLEIKTLGGYTVEQVLSNKCCSKDPQYWYPIKDTNRFLFKSHIAESFEIFYPDVVNPIRNTNQIYLRFLNSLAFCQEQVRFKQLGYYVQGREGQLSYEQYWDEQENICLNGIEIGGIRVTGRHYFALNFGRIDAVPVDYKGEKLSDNKVQTFLRFLDHQYYLLHEFEESLLDGVYSNKQKYLDFFPLKVERDFRLLKKKGVVSVKARRKGFSFIVDNSIYAYNFTFIPSSNSFLFAYEKSKYGQTIKGIHATLNFLNKHSEFGRRKGVLGQYEHFKASYWLTDDNGVKIEEGYMSEIEAVSFKDNPFKGVGNSAYFVGAEECGVFPNFLQTYAVSIEPLIRDGEVWVGNFAMWGSSGDMVSGDSDGLKTVMMGPESYNCMAYANIYEKTPIAGKVGWFIDDLWYSPSYTEKETFLKDCKDERLKEFVFNNYDDILLGVDIEGNSHRWISDIVLENKRKTIKKDSVQYQKLITQQPKYISDAFLITEGSPFDIATAEEALGILKAKASAIGTPGKFIPTVEGKMDFIADLSFPAITEYPPQHDIMDGCWIVYQRPEKMADGSILSGRYIAGNDSIDFGYEESSSSGEHSLAATFILDTFTRNIVAEYIGRPKTADLYYEQLWRGLEFYNADLLYENNLKGLYTYFATKNKIYLLADEPKTLKDKWGYQSNNRTKGFHATQSINSYARSLIHRWSLEEVIVGYTEDNIEIKQARMFAIPSKGILQQMIAWNSRGNFDWISGLGAAMLLLFEMDNNAEVQETKQKGILDSKLFRQVRKLYMLK